MMGWAVGLVLVDLGRVGVLGQVVERLRSHAVAHVVRGGLEVAVELELDVDARFTPWRLRD